MDLLNPLYSFEMHFNVWAQKSLHLLEIPFEFVSQHFSPNSIIEMVVPLVGSLNMELMTRLNLYLGVLNIFSSLLKWVFAGQRPFWWTREFQGPELIQYPLTCETTTGFPSAHSMCFTGLIFILGMFAIAHMKKTNVQQMRVNNWAKTIILGLTALMWYARLYFGCHFLHQCIIGSLLAHITVNFLEKYKVSIFHFGKAKALSIVLGTLLSAVAVYHFFLLIYSDPLWSVRMAFKWCQNPEFLKHYSSPIPSLARDFGFLMGTALSTPLYKRENITLNKKISLPLAAICLFINRFGRQSAPTDSGRLAYVGYEFTRNLIHSFVMLTIIPKIAGKVVPPKPTVSPKNKTN